MPTGRAAARRGLPVHEMLSVPPLIAVAVLVLNDHVLKQACPGVWTGKLSDVAGLFYFPLFLTASARLIVGAARTLSGRPGGIPPLRRCHLLLAITATAAVFTAINLTPAAMAVWDAVLSWGWRSRGTVDPTDLLALPVLALCWGWGLRHVEQPPTRSSAA